MCAKLASWSPAVDALGAKSWLTGLVGCRLPGGNLSDSVQFRLVREVHHCLLILVLDLLPFHLVHQFSNFLRLIWLLLWHCAVSELEFCMNQGQANMRNGEFILILPRLIRDFRRFLRVHPVNFFVLHMRFFAYLVATS